MVQLFNWAYFLSIIGAAGFIVLMYFLLKNKSQKTQKIVLGVILFFSLALHFIKFFIPPYTLDPEKMARDLWFINICAISTLSFPFIFIAKSDTLKDFMFYLGVISGGLALLYPTEAIGSIYVMDTIRFYICHTIIIAVPLLMVVLKVHSLDYRRIWVMPFCMLGVLLMVICNQVLQSELGFVSLRGNDIFDIAYKNTSFIWGPTDDIAVFLTWLTPDFMKVIPYGEFAGEPKYWPFFYMVPAAFFYFWLLPLLLCLPWQGKRILGDLKTLKAKIFPKKIPQEKSEN